MYLQKVISRKTFFELPGSFFVGILKVYDEKSRIRIQDPDPNPDPDPLVRGMDPRIRIRIHTKMSWIRNTACQHDKTTVRSINSWRTFNRLRDRQDLVWFQCESGSRFLVEWVEWPST